MDEQSAPLESVEATPIFGAYRRGYDPAQVDRYVAEQQRRLDGALQRASEAERKLAAAVGQLRELHRRVAVLESEDRQPQPAPLDALGERVQRILQEAWEGAYALRQQAETEVAGLREEAAAQSAEVVAAAKERAAAVVSDAEQRLQAIDAEIERRRTAWNTRLEEDRAKAVAQIAHLHAQRNEAVSELLRLRGMIEKAVQDLGGVPAPAAMAPGPAAAAAAAAAVAAAAVVATPAAPAAPAAGAGAAQAATPAQAPAPAEAAAPAQAAAPAFLAPPAPTPAGEVVPPVAESAIAPEHLDVGDLVAAEGDMPAEPPAGRRARDRSPSSGGGPGSGLGASPASGERSGRARSDEPAVRVQLPRRAARPDRSLEDTVAVPSLDETPPRRRPRPGAVFDFESEQPPRD